MRALVPGQADTPNATERSGVEVEGDGELTGWGSKFGSPMGHRDLRAVGIALADGRVVEIRKWPAQADGVIGSTGCRVFECNTLG
jgi:hypothetical protein